MTIEGFLLLALVLIYTAISYGHSPGESNDGEKDIDQENSHYT